MACYDVDLVNKFRVDLRPYGGQTFHPLPLNYAKPPRFLKLDLIAFRAPPPRSHSSHLHYYPSGLLKYPVFLRYSYDSSPHDRLKEQAKSVRNEPLDDEDRPCPG